MTRTELKLKMRCELKRKTLALARQQAHRWEENYFLFVKYLWIKTQVHNRDSAENLKSKTFDVIK